MDISNNQPELVIGYVTFCNRLTKRMSQMLRVHKNAEVFQSNQWIISKLEIQEHQGRTIISYIKQARCEYLIISKILSSLLIKEILYVNYSNLISLKFINTQIDNIEIIGFLNLPLLRYLGLLFCQITNTKSFIKTHWPNIQTIVLKQPKNNITLRKQFLSRIKTKGQLKNLGFGWFEANFLVFSKLYAQNLSYFHYLENEVLKNVFDLQIYLENQQNVSIKNSFQRFLRRRYPTAQIKTLQL